MSSPINSLPPELLTQVMCWLDTPRNLSSLVTTSKRLHQTFQYSRTAVLAKVIKNAFSPEMINLAIAACRAADISKSWNARPDIKAVAIQQQDLLGRYLRRRTIAPVALNDYDLLLALYKLWSILEYFLSLFEAKSWSVACCKLRPKQIASRGLSEHERRRLQRAFLTFELHRRMTPAHQESDHRHEAYYQTKDFLSLYHPWDREAILSVEEFLVEIARDVVRSARGYTHRQISGLARELAAKPGTVLDEDSLREIETFLCLVAPDAFWLDCPANARSLHYFAARGLPFMKWLSRLSPSNQLHVVVSLQSKRCVPSILECLRGFFNHISSGDVKASEYEGEDAIYGPSYGWTWADANDFIAGSTRLLFRYELRMMGYCFWDAERLNEYWDCSENFQISLQKMLPHPRSMNDSNASWRDREPESGFHAMFKDVQIPKHAFDQSTTLFEDCLNEGRTFTDPDKLYPFPAPFSEREAEMFGFEY